MQNNPNDTAAFSVMRSYRRYAKLISTVLVGLALIIAPIVLAPRLTNMNVSSLLMITVPFGVLLLIVAIVTFVRQGRGLKESTNNQAKSTYVDATGDSIAYKTPQDAISESDSSSLLANQRCIVLLAPVMTSGVTAIGGLGQMDVRNQENAVILTDNVVLAVQIPLATGAVDGAARVGDVLSLLGVGAAEQNMFSSAVGGDQLESTIRNTVATVPLTEIASKYYSYILPLSTVVSIQEEMLGNIVVTTSTGRHIWACKDRVARAQFIQEIKNRITLR